MNGKYIYICLGSIMAKATSSDGIYYPSGTDGAYLYTRDLMELDGKRCHSGPLDSRLSRVHTPLNVDAWKRRLDTHPDKDYARYILSGIEKGFRIGLANSQPLKSATKNMLCAYQHTEIVEEYLYKEVEAGNILGPFPTHLAAQIHINRIGVIPKKHQPGKWRLITDLSYPENKSINDNIPSNLCSLKYVTVTQVASRAVSLGKGALLAKIDIKSAYRLIPIVPQDRVFLGLKWKEAIFVDGMLPFGLCSAPKIFNAVADALEWCISKEGVENIFHYLDDYIIIGPPDSEQCALDLCRLKQVCNDLGVPLAPEKQAGPSSTIEFLGIIIDTVKQELRLPRDKLDRLLASVLQLEHKRSCLRKDLESLVGVLGHACTVIQGGKTFLRNAIIKLHSVKEQHHHVKFNVALRSDLAWWRLFAPHWNGTAVVLEASQQTFEIASDASGSWGCGAIWKTSWFQLKWNEITEAFHIAVKELIPIIIATVIWGSEWKGSIVTAYCDNAAVVSVLNTRYSKEENLMQMVRTLFFIEARYQFKLKALHIPGKHNYLADYLSRNQMSTFHTMHPTANNIPSTVSPSILQWLLDPHLSWTSETWIQQFNTFVSTA